MISAALFAAALSLFHPGPASAAAEEPCVCRNPQSGCFMCIPSCDDSTGKAVRLCEQSKAKNELCKKPGFVCVGCDLIPHSDHAEYYVCKI